MRVQHHMKRTSARNNRTRAQCRHSAHVLLTSASPKRGREADMIVFDLRPGTRMLLLAVGVVLGVNEAAAQVPPLSALPIPAPPNLGDFVRDREAAVVLGKALFWDMQVGSDGVACGSCHFDAGADTRTKNQVSPGLLRVAFQKDAAGNPTAVPAPDR